MYPVLWDLHLGKLGQFTLGTYGLFYAVAFLVAVRVSMAYAKREGIDPTRMIDLGIWTLLSGIVGAKLLLVLVELPYYWRHKMEILYNWRSAGVFYGGFVLACAVGLWYVHRTRLPLARTADAVYEQLDPEQQQVAKRIFLRLAEPGRGTEDTRRRASLTELLPGGDEQAAVEEVLDILERARLVTVGLDA